MKAVGIVCEFNPLTEGHVYLIDEVRRAGAQTVVCLMSGLFVQRGEPAIMPPSYRAEAAVRAGADAVFMLPYPASASGSGYFARTAVDILSRLGCDTLAFGSECGDIGVLTRKAEAISSAHPDLRAAHASDHSPSGIAENFFVGQKEHPNDILGINYILAAREIAPNLGFFTVKRRGAGFCDTSVPEGASPMISATGLRALLEDGRDVRDIPGLPFQTAEAIVKARAEGCFPVRHEAAGSFIHLAWRLAEPQSCPAECGGGLAAFLRRAALETADYAAFVKASSTKRYTNSRIRRAMLAGALGTEKDAPDRRACYVRLLAADSAGRIFAQNAGKAGKICVATRVSDIPDTAEAEDQYRLECKAAALYSLLLPVPRPADTLVKLPPYIEERGEKNA